jgi:hypothetical protein
VRRADDDGGGAVVRGDVVQRLDGRALADVRGDLVLSAERLGDGLDPLARGLAQRDRVLRRLERPAALARVGRHQG